MADATDGQIPMVPESDSGMIVPSGWLDSASAGGWMSVEAGAGGYSKKPTAFLMEISGPGAGFWKSPMGAVNGKVLSASDPSGRVVFGMDQDFLFTV